MALILQLMGGRELEDQEDGSRIWVEYPALITQEQAIELLNSLDSLKSEPEEPID